jgi:tRNA(Glu) U13 pseudouridine synthase TruD
MRWEVEMSIGEGEGRRGEGEGRRGEEEEEGGERELPPSPLPSLSPSFFDVTLSFTLERGSYATMLFRELGRTSSSKGEQIRRRGERERAYMVEKREREREHTRWRGE